MTTATPSAMNRGPTFQMRVVPVRDVNAEDVHAWAALEARAVEPNAYLSPFFVLPAARHLTPESDTIVCFIERLGAGPRDLVGVGIFEKAPASRQFPLPHLIAYRSVHSYLGGMLLHRDCHAQALDALIRGIRRQMPWFVALEIGQAWLDGALSQRASNPARSHYFEVRRQGTVARAVLSPERGPALLQDKAFASRLRDLNRRKRRLEEQGQVLWRWHRDDGIPGATVEDFLALEHMDWKGQAGTSLLSQPSHEAFFREVVSGFASHRRALFTELCLDGQPIASCCNFISGRVGFGFKIGWNPEFRSAAPAKLNEIELMRQGHAAFADIELFDSGAGPDSYINDLWSERRVLTTLTAPTNALGALALQLVEGAKRLRQSLRSGPAPVREPSVANTQVPA
jgi:CelD/BcsL family acetyltransferase involved in cellulose biosynthesis